MLRFIATYRWELWLLLWVPLLGSVTSRVASIQVGILYDIGWLTSYPSFGFGGVGSVLEAGLLLALYARVRRLGRGYLSLVWGYAIAIEGIAVLSWLAVLFLGPSYESASLGATFLWLTGAFLVESVAELALLLMFARKASRFSLAHAFFLYLLFRGYHLPSVIYVPIATQLADLLYVEHSLSTVAILALPIRLVGTMVVGSVLAWLLGNFGPRGVSFRKRAVLGLLAASVMYLIWVLVEIVMEGVPGLLELFGIGGIFLAAVLLTPVLPLALIYLVRVREPAADEQA